MVDMSDLMNYHGTMLNNFNHGQHSRDILLLCGDIESNPGPTGRRSVAQGPSLEEQVTKKFMSVGMISSLQKIYLDSMKYLWQPKNFNSYRFFYINYIYAIHITQILHLND